MPPQRVANGIFTIHVVEGHLSNVTVQGGDRYVRSQIRGYLAPAQAEHPLTLLGVVGALYHARRHNIAKHKRAMLGVYIGGILIAGSLTFVPGRIMHAVAFGH